MSKGLVQNICMKYVTMCFEGKSGLTPSNSFEFERLKEELIENIHVEFSSWPKGDRDMVYRKLIGKVD